MLSKLMLCTLIVPIVPEKLSRLVLTSSATSQASLALLLYTVTSTSSTSSLLLAFLVGLVVRSVMFTMMAGSS